jgi:EpsI family protein
MSPLVSKLGALVSAAVILLFFGLTTALHTRGHGPGEFDVHLERLPITIGRWTGVEAEALSAKSHDILRLDQYIRRLYTSPEGTRVFVYIGYWAKQSGEHQAAKHSPLMCLPANGWKISSPEATQVEIPGGAQSARKLAGKIKNNDILFYYWFFSGEQTYVDETEALFHIMRETVVNARSDGGIVEISVDMDGSLSRIEAEAKAEGVLRDFVKDFSPALNSLLQQRRAPQL